MIGRLRSRVVPAAFVAGVLPAVSWGGTRRTGARVPVYAKGIGAERVSGTIGNTDIFRIIAR